MQSKVFDYAIIGAGAAGLHLTLAMLEEPFFSDKKILILEKGDKVENDRTWCFWEKARGRFDDIIATSWKKAGFVTNHSEKSFDLEPYCYKMLRSKDFYRFAKQKIAQAKNVNWVKEEVAGIQSGEQISIQGNDQHYSAKQVFDSRIDPAFFKQEDKYTRILQHFKGWVIETERDVFDTDEFVMMDFRLKWKDSASFTYILPMTTRKALVEFTLFTPQLIEDDDYDKILQQYIRQILKIEKFKISETEQGIIPMSDYPFHHKSTAQIIKIGTAGSWVKPSSGYSFKNAEKYSKKIVENLVAGKPPNQGLFKKRFQFYDALFLDVLNRQNELGESLFTTMYHRNPIQQIFKFLDNETSLPEEIKIMASFQQLPFLKALGRHLLR